MSAQFFSSLADNALLVAAIETAALGRSDLARAGAGADVRAVLRDPGALRRRLRRRGAQGQGHVHLERHQGGGLPDDAVRRPPAAGLRRRPGRGGLLAGQVRHPHRAAAGLAAGQGQRLDRGPDHPSIILGILLAASWWANGRGACCWAIDLPIIDTGIDTAARGRDLGDRVLLPVAAALVQPASRAGVGRRCSRSPATCRAGARLLQLQRAAVERQARPDLAGHHHAVLGRVGQPARDRARLGRRGAGYSTTQASSLVGVVAIGTAIGAVLASMRCRLDRPPA